MKLVRFKLPSSDDWHVQPEDSPTPASATDVQPILTVPDETPIFTNGDEPPATPSAA